MDQASRPVGVITWILNRYSLPGTVFMLYKYWSYGSDVVIGIVK